LCSLLCCQTAGMDTNGVTVQSVKFDVIDMCTEVLRQ
jgi:hypothetical protein